MMIMRFLHHKILAISIVIFLSLGQLYLYGQEKQNAVVEAQEHYRQGKELYSQGRYEEANIEFGKAAELMKAARIKYEEPRASPETKPEAVQALQAQPEEARVQQPEQVSPRTEAQPPEPEKLITVTTSLSASSSVTLDFKEADIRNVLKIISFKSGVNIVATPEVIGNVTMRLVDVPWEKALDTVVKTYGFGYEWLNDKVIMVSTLEKFSQQRKAQQEAQEMEPLDTQTFVFNFSKAEDIKTSLMGKENFEKLLSARGKVTVETRTNTLIITDTKSNLMRIGEIIKSLDKITPQVMIEARIIETTLGSAEKLGIDWTMRIAASGSKRPTTFPFTEKIKGTGTKMFPKVTTPSEISRQDTVTYDEWGHSTTTTTEQVFHDLVPAFPDVRTNLFTFGTLDFSGLQAVLEILKARSDTKIISNPRITTLNNQTAEIFVGTTVPIPKYGFSTETGTMVISGYEDKKVGITLNVTPNINEQDFITLSVKPSVDEIIGSTGPQGERPVIASRSAMTNVMIKNGQTLVIGGLISENKLKSKKGIPILGDIPILDLIFGQKGHTTRKTELLIFITPHIIKEGMTSPEEIARVEKGLGKEDKPIKEK